jgi:hypothetical protein
MESAMKRQGFAAVFLVLGGVACALGALAADKAQQGVKWRAKVSMQSGTTTLPERTLELCLPDTNPDEALVKQQSQSNCTVSNLKRTGNKTAADIKCTGPSPSDSHWELEKNGDSMRGTMTSKTATTTLHMKYDYTRLGGACPVQAAPTPSAMPQGTLEERRKKLQEMIGGSH